MYVYQLFFPNSLVIKIHITQKVMMIPLKVIFYVFVYFDILFTPSRHSLFIHVIQGVSKLPPKLY
jgi:hypothetical protein